MDIQEKYYQINWTNGMKINKDHFIGMQNAQTQSLQNTARAFTNSFQYGILQRENETIQNIRIAASLHGKVSVQLTKCKAIMADGQFVDLDKHFEELKIEYPSITLDLENDRQDNYFLILTTNPYEPVQVGMPAKQEDPPRQPFTQPKLDLQLVKDEGELTVLGSHQLPIGYFQVDKHNQFIEDAEYVPPCLAISSHNTLIDYFSSLKHVAESLEEKVILLIQKITQREQSNLLSEIALDWCKSMLYPLQAINAVMSLKTISMTPVELVQHFSTLARVMSGNLNTKVGSGKEDFMIYVSEMCNTKIDTITAAMENVIHYEYNHNHIGKGMKRIEHFGTTFLKIIDMLYNLEYIGKRGDAAIFVKEYKTDSQTTNHKTKGFLAD